MSRKTKDRTMKGLTPGQFFLSFYDIGRMLYFEANPATATQIMNDREWQKKRAEFAREYAFRRMKEDLKLAYTEDPMKWEKLPEPAPILESTPVEPPKPSCKLCGGTGWRRIGHAASATCHLCVKLK